jgi:HlyD family secretion protein
MKRKKIIYGSLLLISLAAIIIVFFSNYNVSNKMVFETTKVTKGNIINSVTATGTIQDTVTVLVGTQVSGVIAQIFVDFNSVVKKGQLLAKLDETPLKAALDQSRASVESAEADLKYKQATYERSKALMEKNLIAKADWDLAVNNYESSKANLSMQKANYAKNKINLDYASIYSPIDGVVLSRAVDQGQTVAASFNTPTLFTIANNLKRMRVEAAVDEADIGQVKLGQRVEFTVDSYPDVIFAGKVSQIRLQPVVTSNVVTYTVLIEAPNPDLKLMPGMTANATIFVSENKDVLTLNSKALRFTPDPAIRTEMMKGKSLPQGVQSTGGQNRNFGSAEAGGKRPPAVWVKNGEDFRRVRVETGVSDGANTEIKSGLKEGDEVILSAAFATKGTAAAGAATTSPFMPTRRPTAATPTTPTTGR